MIRNVCLLSQGKHRHNHRHNHKGLPPLSQGKHRHYHRHNHKGLPLLSQGKHRHYHRHNHKGLPLFFCRGSTETITEVCPLSQGNHIHNHIHNHRHYHKVCPFYLRGSRGLPLISGEAQSYKGLPFISGEDTITSLWFAFYLKGNTDTLPRCMKWSVKLISYHLM